MVSKKTGLTRKVGRPQKLQPDEKTLKLVRNLGRIDATTKECAAFLDVSEPTYIKFKKDHPEVEAAYKEGVKAGNVSLRMAQFKLAVEKLNPTMLIWLGKQQLGQRDHKDLGGPGGGPIPIANFDPAKLKDMSDEELAALERALTILGAAEQHTSGEAESGSEPED